MPESADHHSACIVLSQCASAVVWQVLNGEGGWLWGTEGGGGG